MGKEKGLLKEIFNEVAYPLLAIIGTGAIILYTTGEIQVTPTRSVITQASAQQAPSRSSRNEQLLKILQEHPEELTTDIDGYAVLPRAMEYLREEDTGLVTLIRTDSTGQKVLEPDIVVTFRSTMVQRAEKVNGDSIITYAEIVQAHESYKRDLWELSRKEQ